MNGRRVCRFGLIGRPRGHAMRPGRETRLCRIDHWRCQVLSAQSIHLGMSVASRPCHANSGIIPERPVDVLAVLPIDRVQSRSAHLHEAFHFFTFPHLPLLAWLVLAAVVHCLRLSTSISAMGNALHTKLDQVRPSRVR